MVLVCYGQEKKTYYAREPIPRRIRKGSYFKTNSRIRKSGRGWTRAKGQDLYSERHTAGKNNFRGRERM